MTRPDAKRWVLALAACAAASAGCGEPDENHGENSWNLIELSVTRRTPCASSSST